MSVCLLENNDNDKEKKQHLYVVRTEVTLAFAYLCMLFLSLVLSSRTPDKYGG